MKKSNSNTGLDLAGLADAMQRGTVSTRETAPSLEERGLSYGTTGKVAYQRDPRPRNQRGDLKAGNVRSHKARLRGMQAAAADWEKQVAMRAAGIQ